MSWELRQGDALDLRSAATTAAAMSYGGPEDPAIKPEADDGR